MVDFSIPKWIEILSYLNRNKFKTDNYISNICKSVDISHDYTFRVLKALKHKGLVEKIIIKGNKRTRYIKLTKAGETLALYCSELIELRKNLIGDIKI